MWLCVCGMGGGGVKADILRRLERLPFSSNKVIMKQARKNIQHKWKGVGE